MLVGGAGFQLHLVDTRKLRTEIGASGPWVSPSKKPAPDLCEGPFLLVALMVTKRRA